MDTSQKDILVVLVLGLVGLAFLWVPLLAGIPLFLLSYLLLLLLPGFSLISYLKPEMSIISRLVYGFVLSLALLISIFFIVVLFELYSLMDYLPSFLLILSILVALANYLRTRSENKKIKDQGQITLFEAIERAERVRELVNHEAELESQKPEPFSGEPAISGIYKAQSQEEFPEEPPVRVPETPMEVREDVKPLRDELLQNGFDEEEPQPEVSHPMWRDGLPHKSGFIYWDLLIVLILTAGSLAFLILNPVNNQSYSSIISYLALLFLLSYSLVVLFYPAPGSLRLISRLVATILLGLLIFAVSFLLWALDMLVFLSLPLFYLLIIATLVVLLVAGFRRKFASEDEPEPPEDEDIFLEHDQETIKDLEEREAEPFYEEEPVIIPEHLEEEPQDEDLETIIPEVVVLREILEEDQAFTEEEPFPVDEPHKEDIEEIVPEIVDLKKMVLHEEEELPTEEPYEDVEIIIPDHADPPEEKKAPESTLKTIETEYKAIPKESLKESPELVEEPPEQTPTETKGLVLPWIERQKGKKVPHVYEDKPRPITPKWIRSTRPLDLILVVIFTLLTAAFVLIPVLNETPVRIVLGVFLVLFLPGYSLIAALFPRRGDLDSIERVALSFGLSIAFTSLIGLALNYTPGGIRLDPILICLVGFTLVMCLIAYLRRRSLPDKEKFAVAFG